MDVYQNNYNCSEFLIVSFDLIGNVAFIEEANETMFDVLRVSCTIKHALEKNQVSIVVAGTVRSLTTVNFEHPSNLSSNGGCFVLTTPDRNDLFLLLLGRGIFEGFQR